MDYKYIIINVYLNNMTLISSISGIRGTVDGENGSSLTPIDIVKYTSAFGKWINKENTLRKSVVIARDGRISGQSILPIVRSTLISMGIDVIDTGLSSTPTTQIIVKKKIADGGIILTASHNPKNWNALKLFNCKGEFLSQLEIDEILQNLKHGSFIFKKEDNYGKIFKISDAFKTHIKEVIKLNLVMTDEIRKSRFKIVVDGINSSGGVVVPRMLRELNSEVIELNCIPDGNFAHNPEPLEQNLTKLKELVIKEKADLGIAVDPDVDRLVFICENGKSFGEENTLVVCSDYVLSNEKGATVSNMSSSMSLEIITKKHDCNYFSSRVGEINVVEKMKEVKAVIGGEGNGGVIYPESHYGRDALVGIGLFLSKLSTSNMKASELLDLYPKFIIKKDKLKFNNKFSMTKLKQTIKKKYNNSRIDCSDGVKIFFDESWLHVRKSNTEPIIRVYCESKSLKECNYIIEEFKKLLD